VLAAKNMPGVVIDLKGHNIIYWIVVYKSESKRNNVMDRRSTLSMCFRFVRIPEDGILGHRNLLSKLRKDTGNYYYIQAYFWTTLYYSRRGGVCVYD
jgi:hypothetical protein